MTVEEDAEGKRRWKAPMDSRTDSSGRSMTKKEKVRKKTLSKSSREWVDRQLRDPYVRKAQDAGYRARAAYKIKEIDEKFHVLKRGARVVDLGSAPGGWLQVVIETGAARVVGIDLLPVTSAPPHPLPVRIGGFRLVGPLVRQDPLPALLHVQVAVVQQRRVEMPLHPAGPGAPDVEVAVAARLQHEKEQHQKARRNAPSSH